MKKAKKSPHLKQMVQALRLVAPFCVAARYDDGFKHCVETSVSGAAALRRRHIIAQPVVCAVMVFKEDGTSGLTIGLSPRQIYDRARASDGPSLPPFEEWKEQVARGVPEEEHPIHEIIEARHNGERALIDLTLGQLRQTGIPDSDKIPLTVMANLKKGWPDLQAPPWRIAYMDSPHDAQVLAESNAKVSRYSNQSFVDDLSDMMDLAIKEGLELDRVLAEMRRQQPETFKTCIARINALSSRV